MPETTIAESFQAAEAPWTYEAAVKDPAVEEPIDFFWHRRVTFQVMRPLQWGGHWITPWQLTLLSGVLGVLAGVAYYRAKTDGPMWFAIGTGLLFVSVIFDCMDGMLARLRGGGTQFGMLLDGAMDLVVGLAVWFGLAHAALAGMTQWWAWPGAVFALVSIVVHCALYDSVKNFFVRHSLPRSGRPPIEPPAPASGPWRVVHVVYRTCYGFVAKVFGAEDDAELDAAEPAEFRKHFMGTMRLVSWLGLGTHLFIVYTAGLLGVFALAAPFVGVMITVALGLNVVTVCAIVSRRKSAQRLRESLKVS